MAAVNSIESNVAELRFAEESSAKVLPGSPTWYALEPNSFREYGGQVETVAREPFSADRQRSQGEVVNVVAGTSFNHDLVPDEVLQRWLEGYMHADLRKKDELSVATVDGSNDDFEPASGGDGYVANDLLFAKDFDDSANNGLHLVSGTPAAASVPVTTDLAAASSQSGTISRVGFQFSSGDAQIDVSGTLPALTTTTKDMTDFGLIVGEWIYIGGDAAAEKFASATDNGWARVRSVAANKIEFDLTEADMVTDNGSGKTLRVFFARLLKNESSSSLIKRKYRQLELQMGAPDDASPSQIQASYLTGGYSSEMTLNLREGSKVDIDFSVVALDEEHIDGPTALKTGTRPTAKGVGAFNTTTNLRRIHLAKVTAGDATPSKLFAFAEEMTLRLSNNATVNGALGQVGGFAVNAGKFSASGQLQVYLAGIDAVKAVRAGDDLALDLHFARDNKGVSIDLPLLSGGDARPNVVQDESIKLPVSYDASKATSVFSGLNHTLLLQFWDYLPNAAQTD